MCINWISSKFLDSLRLISHKLYCRSAQSFIRRWPMNNIEKNRLTWKIGGKAGEGIMATGIIFSQSCSRGGLHVYDINEYPSLIKGGHNMLQVRVEDREIF